LAEKVETFAEKCARLGVVLDDSSGSEVIFAGKNAAKNLQKQSGTTPKKP
jgi:hypothetical protein